MKGTQSVGVALLFWFAGALFTIAGAYMVVEFGLTIPRYFLDGVDQAVPRSGGTLNYVSASHSTSASLVDECSCNMPSLSPIIALDPFYWSPVYSVQHTSYSEIWLGIA